jgi:hypothetical protein
VEQADVEGPQHRVGAHVGGAGVRGPVGVDDGRGVALVEQAITHRRYRALDGPDQHQPGCVGVAVTVEEVVAGCYGGRKGRSALRVGATRLGEQARHGP